MADSKVFKLSGGISTGNVAKATAKFLEDRKNLEAEVIQVQGGYIIQARQKALWKKVIGFDNSMQIQMNDRGDDVVVSIGSGEWIDKVGAGAVGYFVFPPLMLTAAAGTFFNWLLPDEILTFIGSFISTGGTMPSGGVCPSCGKKCKTGSAFCGICGTKLEPPLSKKMCRNCGAELKHDNNFCVKCGTNIDNE